MFRNFNANNQSSEIWKESGRYDDYGEEMLRIKDRQNREMLYGPTNEELIIEIFRFDKIYKSLPQLLYHIQWKFRDELRLTFGIMRCREFYMKMHILLIFQMKLLFFHIINFSCIFKYICKNEFISKQRAETGPIGGNLS